MSTMHAGPNDFTKTGLGINRYTGIDYEPGFLDFVHKAAVDKYLDEAEDIFTEFVTLSILAYSG